MHQPLVSVICLCHNQQPYVTEALQSVLDQTYPHIELIVVDDASTDGSQHTIRQWLAGKPHRFIELTENVGNCAAFNRGFRESRGEWIIDLAADDVLLPHRVELGIQDSQQLPETTGVLYSDAFLMDAGGHMLRTHHRRNADGQLLETPPSGDLYVELIRRYFICPPTMMMRRSVLEHLGGYDETLHYEDFDFWVRSSRSFHYHFQPAPLVKKRLLPHSHSARQRQWRSAHQQSTYRICQKIHALNRTPAEHRALRQRCTYEFRQAILLGNWGLAWRFGRMGFRANTSFEEL